MFSKFGIFSSDHIGNLTVELILASAEVIFKKNKNTFGNGGSIVI